MKARKLKSLPMVSLSMQGDGVDKNNSNNNINNYVYMYINVLHEIIHVNVKHT